MAGRERSGAGAARGDLFDGRAWVVVPDRDEPAGRRRPGPPGGHRGRRRRQRRWAPPSTTRPSPWSRTYPRWRPASSPAGSATSSDPAVALAGQGLRDVTRIAASDPRLWTQILAGNAAAVRDVLTALRADLDEVIGALDQLADGDSRGALEVVNRTVGQGNVGVARIPGKHGAAPTAYETVVVVVPDSPARWAGCSPRSARPASTSRTSTSSTGSGSRSGWPRSRCVPGAVREAAGRPRGPRLARP